VVNDLLKDLQQEGFLVYGCADDSQLVRGNFLNILRDHVINAMKTVQRLCETKSLTLNPLKTNVTVFTRKWKPKPIKPLRLRGKKKIAVTLGVLLDPKLNWKQHLTEKEEILLIYVDM
jgi:hypothetical protein